MTKRSRHLVVGIGSAHGDDQAGWLLIDALLLRNRTSVPLRKAAVPHDMIDWLDDCKSLHIVDACDSEDAVRRFDLSNGNVTTNTNTRCGSSHQMGVGDVMQLARSLGRLPEQVILWAIPGHNFHPGGAISEPCMKQVELCADRIQKDLFQP